MINEAASDDEDEPPKETEDTSETKSTNKHTPETSTKKRKRADTEYGVSRGIDFQNVSFVINFDLPEPRNPISTESVVQPEQGPKEPHSLS